MTHARRRNDDTSSITRISGGLYKSKTSPALGQERLRERSKSVGHEMVDSKCGKKRFPKWSRVKEALGWERTTPVNYADRRQSERQRSSPRAPQRQNRGARGGSKSQSCKEYRLSEPIVGGPEGPVPASSEEEDVSELASDRLRLGKDAFCKGLSYDSLPP